MVQRGVRHLDLLLRKGGATAKASDFITTLEFQRVSVSAITSAVADQTDLFQAFEELPPSHRIKEIIHAAMSLQVSIPQSPFQKIAYLHPGQTLPRTLPRTEGSSAYPPKSSTHRTST